MKEYLKPFRESDFSAVYFSALLLFLLSGCMHPADVYSTKTTTFADGTTETVRTRLRTPKYSKEGTQLVSTADGVQVFLGASQRAKDIGAAEGDAASKRLIYGGLALIMLLGAVALALPNAMVSNKDALIIMGCGIIGFAVFQFVEAAAPAMGIIIPICAVAGGFYLFWQWNKNRRKNVTAEI